MSNTIPPLSLIALAFDPGVREQVVPDPHELRQLGPSWVRFLLNARAQNFDTGQNADLDWLLDRYHGIDVKVLALINQETIDAEPPDRHAPPAAWGNANSGYIARVAQVAQKIAAFYRERIGAIEIFNEPDNFDGQDTARVPAEADGSLLAAAFDRIKAVSQLPVILGGIFDSNGGYLRRVVQVAGGKFDGAGLHPYGIRIGDYPAPVWGPPFRNNADMRQALLLNRQIAGKPLWLTELGADVNKYTFPAAPNAAKGVAEYMQRLFNLCAALGEDTIARVFWFTWKFPATAGEAGSDWGIVDPAGNRREAWFVFQQLSQQAGIARHIPLPPAITSVTFAPTTLDTGQVLRVNVGVRNDDDEPLLTQDPPPDFVYDEGESFVSRGFVEAHDAIRVGVDYDGRTGIDHPYRWGLSQPLAPGQTATVTGGIRLKNPQSKNFWVGLVREQVAWLQDRQGAQLISVAAPQPAPDLAALQQQVAQLQAQIAQLQQQVAQANGERNRLRAVAMQVRQIVQNSGL